MVPPKRLETCLPGGLRVDACIRGRVCSSGSLAAGKAAPAWGTAWRSGAGMENCMASSVAYSTGAVARLWRGSDGAALAAHVPAPSPRCTAAAGPTWAAPEASTRRMAVFPKFGTVAMRAPDAPPARAGGRQSTWEHWTGEAVDTNEQQWDFIRVCRPLSSAQLQPLSPSSI